MYYDIKEARYVDGYKLEIIFEDGKKGIVDLQEYARKGGLFDRFSDLEYFKQFYINKELNVLCWPDGLDIAPETLYSKATGEPLPTWVSPETNKPQRKVVKKAL